MSKRQLRSRRKNASPAPSNSSSEPEVSPKKKTKIAKVAEVLLSESSSDESPCFSKVPKASSKGIVLKRETCPEPDFSSIEKSIFSGVSRLSDSGSDESDFEEVSKSPEPSSSEKLPSKVPVNTGKKLTSKKFLPSKLGSKIQNDKIKSEPIKLNSDSNDSDFEEVSSAPLSSSASRRDIKDKELTVSDALDCIFGKNNHSQTEFSNQHSNSDDSDLEEVPNVTPSSSALDIENAEKSAKAKKDSISKRISSSNDGGKFFNETKTKVIKPVKNKSKKSLGAVEKEPIDFGLVVESESKASQRVTRGSKRKSSVKTEVNDSVSGRKLTKKSDIEEKKVDQSPPGSNTLKIRKAVKDGSQTNSRGPNQDSKPNRTRQPKEESKEESVKVKKEIPDTVDSLDIAQLLALGEGLKANADLGLEKNSSNADSESDDWEEVDAADLKKHEIPKEGVQITVDAPEFSWRRKKQKDQQACLQAEMNRAFNRVRKELQLLCHKASLLLWLAHGVFLNRIINNDSLKALALSLVPTKLCDPPQKPGRKYVELLLEWFSKDFECSEGFPEVLDGSQSRPALAVLEQHFSRKYAKSAKELTFMFITALRALSLEARLIISFQPMPLKPQKDELLAINQKSLKSQKTSSNNESDELPPKSKSLNQLRKNPGASGSNDVDLKQVTTSSSALHSAKPKETEATKKETLSAKTKGAEKITKPGRKSAPLSSSSAQKTINSKKELSRKSEPGSSNSPSSSALDSAKLKETEATKKGTRSAKTKGAEKITKPGRKSAPLSSSSAQKTIDSKKDLSRKSEPVSSNSPVKTRKMRGKAPKNTYREDSQSEDSEKVDDVDPIISPGQKRSLSQKSTERLMAAASTRLASRRRFESPMKQLKTPKGRPSKSFSQESDDDFVPEQKSSSKEVTKKSPYFKKLVTSHSESENDSESESDSDFERKPKEKRKRNFLGNKTPQKRRQSKGSSSKLKDDDSSKKQLTSSCSDYWVEVYLRDEERWTCVDVPSRTVDSTKKILAKATQPVCYVIAFNPDGSLKDVTKRYAPKYSQVTVKQRVSSDWWEKSLKPFRSKNTRREAQEDSEMNLVELDRPMPKNVGECKNHPLYVLKRHLLKFEAIYPPDAPSLGFVRGEAIYARQNVYTLHSREIWMKEAKVVRLGEKPYKIVKARPKYDRLSGKVITDLPLEIFGPWQVEDYVPPPAVNGKVPRNAYGNVELFKPTMLPKGTVHLQVPGLSRVAKKLRIDCAPAVVGFDYHSGGCHPTYDGFVVCEEHVDILMDAWNKDIDESAKRREEKHEKRIYGNWRRLIKGLLIREALKSRYDFQGETEELPGSSQSTVNSDVLKASRIPSEQGPLPTLFPKLMAKIRSQKSQGKASTAKKGNAKPKTKSGNQKSKARKGRTETSEEEETDWDSSTTEEDDTQMILLSDEDSGSEFEDLKK